MTLQMERETDEWMAGWTDREYHNIPAKETINKIQTDNLYEI